MSRHATNLAFSALLFLVPFATEPLALAHPGPWLAFLCSMLILSSQPGLDREETLHIDGVDRGSALFIYAAMIGAQLAAVLDFRFAPLTAPGAQTLSGVALIAVGMSLRIWSIRTLGRFFTGNVRVVSDQQVVRTGPYRLVRHPSYAGALITAAGSALALQSGLGVALVVALCVPAYLYRIHVEEQRLVSELGRPYVEYMRQSSRLVPGVF